MDYDNPEKLRRVLRLATHLADDERDQYIAAATEGDAALRDAVYAFFARNLGEERTIRHPASAEVVRL